MGLLDEMKDKAQDAAAAAGNVVPDGVKDAAGNVVEGAQNVAGTVVDAAGNVVDKATDVIPGDMDDKLVDKARDLFGGGDQTPPQQ